MDCRLTITAEPDATIVIKFDQFNLEEDEDGKYVKSSQADEV